MAGPSSAMCGEGECTNREIGEVGCRGISLRSSKALTRKHPVQTRQKRKEDKK